MSKVILPFRNPTGSVEVDEFTHEPIFRPARLAIEETLAIGFRTNLDSLVDTARHACKDGWTTIADEAPAVLAELGITHRCRAGMTSRKIEAIKVLRSRSGCSLKEAKDAIEAAMDKLPEWGFCPGDTVYIRGVDVPWVYISSSDGVATLARGVGRERVQVSVKEDSIGRDQC